MKNPTLIITIIALILGGGIIFLSGSSSAASGGGEVVNREEWVKGKLDSKVTLIEYGDFQCPACKSAESTIIKPYLSKYLDKVKIVFRNFPLKNIHAKAFKAAEAAEAAGNQGKFWEMHDLLFEKSVSDGSSLTIDKLKEYAQSLNLDMTKFNQELDSGKYKPDVNADMKLGDKDNVTGTPTYFVNGKIIEGSTLDEIAKNLNLATEEALANTK